MSIVYDQLGNLRYIPISNKEELFKYFKICSQSENSEYTEIHHIIPKCLKGKLEKENEVILSYPSHVKAHISLALALNHYGLTFAAQSMVNNKKFSEVTNNFLKEKEELKIKHSKLRTQLFSGKNHPNYQKEVSEEVRKKISKTLMGNIPWNKGKNLSEEHRQKISETHWNTSGKNNPAYDHTIYGWINYKLNIYYELTKFEFRKIYGYQSSPISGLSKGKRRTYYNWYCLCLI